MAKGTKINIASTNIRERMRALDAKQVSLCRTVGIGRNLLNMFLNGHVDLKPEQVARIDQVLEALRQERMNALKQVTSVQKVTISATA